MKLETRKQLLVQLGKYMQGNDEEWQKAKQKAFSENAWFIPEFIELSVNNIARQFLQPHQLEELISKYELSDDNSNPTKVGIVMAGNIPLVGFHDLLCVFLSGNCARIKPSSKDQVLIKHLVSKLMEWNGAIEHSIMVGEIIKNCDAYIATGSNNSSRYFEYYFQKYLHIIRRNRTSVAILTGNESNEELEKLADDVHQYFGLGCRNVTKIFVPENYDFILLLNAFKKYDYLIHHHKYKNNYDYNLALHLLNNTYYMTNGSILLTEAVSPFSPISQLHYGFYTDINKVEEELKNDQNIQCIAGPNKMEFGKTQLPDICDYADGTDTMLFLKKLSNNASLT